MACRVTYDSKGVASVNNTIGTPSKLYEKILAITQDQTSALDAWAAANMPESGLRGEATSIEELLAFMDRHTSTLVELNPEEIGNISEIMRKKGFETLSDLSAELNALFKPKGFIELPTRDLSGMFTQDDLRSIDLSEVSQLMQRIDGHLLTKGEIYAKPSEQKSGYIDISKKNLLGMSETVSYEEMMSDIIKNIEDFKDETQIERAVKASPFTELINSYNNNEQFRKSFNEGIKELRRIPTLSIVAGELSADNNTHYTTVKNTITRGADTTTVDAEMEYIASINKTIWEKNPKLVEEVLKEVEASLADIGVDVVGISSHVTSREVIIDILNEVSLMLRQPTHSNIKSFTDKLSLLVPQDDNSVVEVLDKRFEGLNIVHLETQAKESELFNKFGLIRVGENLYHKVDHKADFNTVVDFMYNEINKGIFTLPKEFAKTKDLTDKKGVLEDIHRFLGTQVEIEGLENKNLYSAYKTIFGHTSIEAPTSETIRLETIQTDSKYLKTGFITDFYNYILKEKVKGSQIYRDVLSKFIITDKDITIKGKPLSIKGIKFEKELKDYIKLKRGSKMSYLINTDALPISEDLVTLNFPETVKEFTGEYTSYGKHLVLPSSPRLYVKVDGQLYRKSASNTHSDAYTLITSPTNETYYSNNLDFSFDKTEVISILDSHQNVVTPKEFIAEESKVESKIFSETNNIEDYSTILDSQIKIVNLYNEATIREEIDECAG